MFRNIIWYIHFGISLIFKIPHMYKVKRLKNKLSDDDFNLYIHKVTSKWAKSHVKLSGARVRVFGQESIPKDEPVVFVSNHQGNFDIALLMSYIDKPKGYVAKVEIQKVPVLRTWMDFMHCIFLDRSNIRKSLKTILEGIDILKGGQSLVIFPEGTRSRSDKIGEFKAGSFKLATKAKVPIIPITINGSYKLMEGNNNRITPADVEVYVHPMIETANLSKAEIDALPDTVKEIISSKLPA